MYRQERSPAPGDISICYSRSIRECKLTVGNMAGDYSRVP